MKKIIVILLTLINITCSSQKKDSLTIKTYTMEHFNIKKFYENNPNGNRKEIILNDGTKIEQFENTDYYQEIISDPKKPYSTYKGYSKKNGTYLGGSQKFYTIDIGIYKLYNENGDIIKEIDQNKPYKFSVEDLIKKFKSEYDIDLINVNEVQSINRASSDKEILHPFYEVALKDHDNFRIIHVYLIHGNTGATLFQADFDTKVRNTEKGTLIQQYIKRNKSTLKSYKTYQGKDYTQEEWKAFEQKMWEEHQKKNRK